MSISIEIVIPRKLEVVCLPYFTSNFWGNLALGVLICENVTHIVSNLLIRSVYQILYSNNNYQSIIARVQIDRREPIFKNMLPICQLYSHSFETNWY